MQDSIGVLVDFRKSCEAIVRYVFRDTLDSGALDKDTAVVSENFTIGFEKMRSIEEDLIDFTQKLEFDKEPEYRDEYTRVIGEHIKARINEEFQWNLFFRILFAIEPENNRGDFENYLHYYTHRLYSKINYTKLNGNFTDEETKDILDKILFKFGECFVTINSVELLYDNMVDQVIKHINNIVESISQNFIISFNL